ncbi:MAG: transcriptional repressor [Treponema sp.]|nr:transcriptional repressor [Treponema sp.]
MRKNYTDILKNAGIRPSVQRLAVYSWICENPVHPDVDTVYTALAPDYPTLSKTTVYNTLQLFEEKKIVQSVKIEEDRVLYDAEMSDHLHFKCTMCNKVFDILNNDKTASFSYSYSSLLPVGFTTAKIQTYLWGTCDYCSK